MTNNDLYHLADALGMVLEVSSGDVSGRMVQRLSFNGTRVEVPMTIVSSFMLEKGVAVLMVSMGDLGVLAVSGAGEKPAQVVVALLDRSLLKRDDGSRQALDGLLEKMKPASAHEVLELIKPGLVKAFVREGVSPWRAAA